MADEDHTTTKAHAWVATGFFELTEAHAERVACGDEPPTVGVAMPERQVGCKQCGSWWSPTASTEPCVEPSVERTVARPARNAPCPGGCGQKVKRCACPRESTS